MSAARILFVNPDSRRHAGSNVSLLGIIDGLDRARFEPVVAVPPAGEFAAQISARGVETLDYGMNAWWYPTTLQFHQTLAGLRDRVDRLARLIRESDIRLVYTNVEYCFDGALAAALCGVPHVWCMRPPFTDKLDILEHFPLSPAALGLAMDRLSAMIVCDCVSQRDSFPSSVPPHKLRVIESGIDIPGALPSREAARAAPAARLGIAADSRIVLNVSRMSPEKDLATFLHTARQVVERHPDTVHFVHLGRSAASPHGQDILRLADTLGLGGRFHHIGEVESVYDVMRAAEVFLLTSVDYEGLVRVCAEAMLTEVPVVSTRCGGPEDYVIEGQTGYLTGVGDAAGLARHVVHLLDHPAQARDMGLRARALIAEKYDQPRMNALWMDLFDELTAAPARAGFDVLTLEFTINTLTRLGDIGSATDRHAKLWRDHAHSAGWLRRQFVQRPLQRLKRWVAPTRAP